ncbi:hypothetical protein ACFW0H_04145 [Pseudomonas sp. CR3202]|uniref:hypothetical protein n=1 Tax=Pseudomonas sp. CR3202 TaxID=3351532 RepID=UPI003BF4488A
MKDDFENIRAERDALPYRQAQTNKYSGLWKQIALGIVVGYTAVGLLSAVGWLIVAKLAMGSLQVNIP